MVMLCLDDAREFGKHSLSDMHRLVFSARIIVVGVATYLMPSATRGIVMNMSRRCGSVDVWL